MYHFLKRLFAGLQQAGNAPAAAPPGRRTCPAVERLEERLALASIPNLAGDTFLFQNIDVRGQHVALVQIVQEDPHTGAFTATFEDLTAANPLATKVTGTGQIGRTAHNLSRLGVSASITFLGTGAIRPNPFLLAIETASFSGFVKGQRLTAVISAQLTLGEYVVGLGNQPTNVTLVNGHVIELFVP